ncbi:MAG: tetratricopeptide repeat protein, partial [Candidatus Methylomirabilis sp.]
MSFDLALWKWVEPKPKKISADEVYADLAEDQEHSNVAPFDRDALEAALATGLGVASLDSSDLLTYSTLYRCLVIHLPWDKVDDVAPRIRKIAAAQGFHCHDPQKSKGLPSLAPTKKELLTEFERTKEKAERGNVEAQARLGFFYEFGEGVAKNLKTAVTRYAKAAEQGNKEALFNLAGCYMNGTGLKQDPAKAVEIYAKLIDQGDEDAMFALAEMYEKGDGVLRDVSRALDLYQ